MKNTKMFGVIFFAVLLCLSAQTAYAENILLKVLAINPSKDKEQEVPIKSYLPQEAKPEYVVNRDEVDVQFDAAKSLYYVEKKVTLKPGETYTLQVELEDVWMVPQAELDSLRGRADKAMDAVKGAGGEDVARLLYDNVMATLKIIQSRQSNETQVPQEHIATYRLNLKLLEQAKNDLNSLEEFSVKNAGKAGRGAGAAGKEGLLGSISFTWKLILGIVGFLALLSAGSWVVWQKQMKDMLKTREIDILPTEERVALNKRLLTKATRDDLTGMFNVGHFKLLFRTELRGAKARPDKPISVIMADVDYFKKINDTYGHAAGDEVLKGVAKVFLDRSTNVNVACRYGGEEFMMMLPGSDLDEAEAVAEKIRKAVQEKEFVLGDNKVRHPVTISLGVALYNRQESGDDLIKRADKALYSAKQAGRNRVVKAVATPGVAA